MKFYAGIGSRETPGPILERMERIARFLGQIGYTLASGGAEGADTAFERGAKKLPKVIYTAEDSTPEAYEMAARYHPAWERCSEYARLLHARNGFIVLGRQLCNPVDFIVCWTPDGKASGGTGQALRIAADPRWGIDVFNLHDPDAARRLYRRVSEANGHLI